MSEHATQAVLEPQSHLPHSGNGEPEQAPVHELRFEKSELQYFVDDDRYAGSNLGKLLAATFLILVVLMTAVTLWTNRHQFSGQDPFEPEDAPAATSGH